jgi:hypothetical protein
VEQVAEVLERVEHLVLERVEHLVLARVEHLVPELQVVPEQVVLELVALPVLLEPVLLEPVLLEPELPPQVLLRERSLLWALQLLARVLLA